MVLLTFNASSLINALEHKLYARAHIAIDAIVHHACNHKQINIPINQHLKDLLSNSLNIILKLIFL